MAKRITKKGQVLEHLKTYGKINTWQAINLYNATRLSAIIFNLKEEGYDIESEKWVSRDINGNSITYCEYIYHGKSE